MSLVVGKCTTTRLLMTMVDKNEKELLKEKKVFAKDTFKVFAKLTKYCSNAEQKVFFRSTFFPKVVLLIKWF